MNIFKDGLLIDISVSYWSGAKMLTAKDLGLKEEDISNAFNLGRKMLVPKEVIKKFRAIEARARSIVDTNSFKFPIGNARFVPKKKFPKVFNTLKTYQQEYLDEVDNLTINYEKYREEMIPIYKEAAEIAFMKQLPATQEFSIESMEKEKEEFVNSFLERIQKYYPTSDSLRDKFSLGWDVYEIALPRMKKGEANTIAQKETHKQIADEEYRNQANQKIDGFLNEVVSILRGETIEICNRILTNMKEGKIVQPRSISSLKDFIDKFSELNFVGDQKIEDELSSLREEFINIYPAKLINQRAELSNELTRRLHEISSIATDMTDINTVTGEYRRKIDWKD